MKPIENNRLLETEEAARFLAVSSSLLKQWRGKGIGPRFVLLGPRLVRYCQEDLQIYRDSLTKRSSTMEAHDE